MGNPFNRVDFQMGPLHVHVYNKQNSYINLKLKYKKEANHLPYKY